MEPKELIFRSLFVISFCLAIAFTSASPQWVWNREVVNSNRFDTGQTSRFPESATERNEIRVEGSTRLLPSAINAISNSLQGLGGGGGVGSNGGGGVSGLIGALINRFPQLATSAISGIINRPINIPAKDPGVNFPDESSGSGGSSGSSGSSCKCVSSNECFLPFKPTGSCGGGRVQCCSGTRGLFPDDNSSGTKTTKNQNERTVTQRELRRGLLQQILRGGGSIVDDTLDLILAPYLSKEDQQRLATRVFTDE